MSEKAPQFESATVVETPEKKSKLKHLEIEQLREPTKTILDQMRESVDRGEYTHVIGDDASGRIPALIFNKILGGIYKEKGHIKPKTKFLAMERLLAAAEQKEKIEQIKKFIDKHIVEKNKDAKVLVVTDVIFSGMSLRPLIQALQEKFVGFDVAAIGFTGDVREKDEMFGSAKVFYGISDLPAVYGARALAGVKKSRGELFSHPVHLIDSTVFKEKKEARQDVNALSEDLIRWYLETD